MNNPEMMKRLAAKTAASSQAAQDVETVAEDHFPHESRAGRVGLWALAAGLAGLLLWAGFAPLDEGVPAMASVSIDTKRKPVQHLNGGLIKDVLVREGDKVREGQVLIRLDSATVRANFEASRQRYLGLRAVQGRLLAEQSGQSTISFHPDLVAASTDPLIKEQMVNQQQLLLSRRASLQADLQSLEESIQGQRGMIQGYENVMISRKSQLALLNEELENTRGMVKEGYAPRNRQIELERSAADVNASIADLGANVIRANRAIGENRQRAIGRQQEYRKEIEGMLSDVGREALSESQKFIALQNDLGRIEIKAPASGQVVSLAIQSAGGVIGAGQKLMDIVPENESLLLEARVAPHLIDKVHAGLAVDIRFSNFAHSPQLVVAGKVLSVSGDLIVEPQNPGGFFLARIGVTPEGMKELGARQLQPGMPAEVVFKTGERSMLTYLMSPLVKRMAAAMKEE